MDACLLGGAKSALPSSGPSLSVADVAPGARSAEERAMFSAASSCARLAPGESLEPLLAQAAAAALEAAGVEPRHIDRVHGAALLGRHLEPSPLYFVQRALGLRRDALIVPLGTNYSAFITGLVLAAEAVRHGAARHVLVLVGSRMSCFVEPGTGYALSVADGAGAVVVGAGERDVIVDYATDNETSLYDAAPMDMRSERLVFDIEPERLIDVRDYGCDAPPRLIAELLGRHGIHPSEIALVTHQTSRVLLERWREAIRPGEYLDTFDDYGNATIASIPMTLAARGASLSRPYLVLMTPGMGMHATAVLIKR